MSFWRCWDVFSYFYCCRGFSVFWRVEEVLWVINLVKGVICIFILVLILCVIGWIFISSSGWNRLFTKWRCCVLWLLSLVCWCVVYCICVLFIVSCIRIFLIGWGNCVKLIFIRVICCFVILFILKKRVMFWCRIWRKKVIWLVWRKWSLLSGWCIIIVKLMCCIFFVWEVDWYSGFFLSNWWFMSDINWVGRVLKKKFGIR